MDLENEDQVGNESVPEGSVVVEDAHLSLLIQETKYLTLRLVKTIVALFCYGIAIVIVPVGVLLGLLAVLSGFQGRFGPQWIVYTPLAIVVGYGLASIAILCTERHTRTTRMPGIIEIVCPACSRDTPLLKSCSECGIKFIFDEKYESGIAVGLVHALNWLLSVFWYLICAVGLLILIAGML